MASITVGELKNILEEYPDHYEVVMNIHHNYDISKESGQKGWIAFINGIKENQKIIDCKVTLLGDSGVGKSSIIGRYISGVFMNGLISTTGANYSQKVVEKDNNKVRLNIWDTAGQEKYKGLIPSYVRNSSIAKKLIESGDASRGLTIMNGISEWFSTDFTFQELSSVFNLLLKTKNYTSLDTFDLVDFFEKFQAQTDITELKVNKVENSVYQEDLTILDDKLDEILEDLSELADED